MLLGRADELAALRSWLRDARTGVAGVLRIEGEAGIGKTALLAELLAEATRLGVDARRGRGDALGETRPFGPLLDARLVPPVEELLALTGRGGFGTDRASPLETGPELRSLLVECVLERLEAGAARAPLIVAIDDAQWADSATLVTLATATRRCADLPLGIVVTVRSGAGTPENRQLLDQLGGTRVTPAPLGADDVDALCAALLGAPPGADLSRVLDRCAGNPLLVVESITTMQSRGDLVVRDGRAERADPAAGLPVTLRDTVRQRMTPLEGEIRVVAAIAALLGSRFTVGELAAITRRSPVDLLPLVEQLIEAALLRDEGDALSFRHDLVRETVVDALPEIVRAELHQTIADGLRAAGAPVARVAEHIALASPQPSGDAVDVLRRAASEVLNQDPASATRLLRRALQLSSGRGREHDELLAQLIDALTWDAQTAEALRLADEMLLRPVAPATEEKVRSALGRALVLLGRPQESIAHELRVVELQAAEGRSTAWASAECAMCRLFGVDLDGALSDAQRAVELATVNGDVMARVLALCVETFARNTIGDSSTAVARGEEAVRLADSTPGGEGHRLHPHLFHGVALQTLGRHRDAQAAFRRGRELGEALGASWALPIYHFVTALALWDAGEWDDLLAEVDAGIAFGAEKGSTIAQVWAYAVAGRVHLHRGQLDAARDAFDRGDAVLAAGGLQYGIDWLLLGRSLLLEATGAPDDARSTLRAGWEGAIGLQAAAALTTFGPDLSRMAAAAGDDSLARTVADRLAAIAEAHPDDVVARRARRARQGSRPARPRRAARSDRRVRPTRPPLRGGRCPAPRRGDPGRRRARQARRGRRRSGTSRLRPVGGAAGGGHGASAPRPARARDHDRARDEPRRVGVGRTHPDRARGRRRGLRRPVERAGRRTSRRQSPHRRGPPAQHLPQARCAHPARPGGRASRPGLVVTQLAKQPGSASTPWATSGQPSRASGTGTRSYSAATSPSPVVAATRSSMHSSTQASMLPS